MDHDSFLMHQCHRNYVNLYIYIIKPDPERSGLSLVRSDAQAAADPSQARVLHRGLLA